MGVPIAKGLVAGTYAVNAFNKYGMSTDSFVEFFWQQGIHIRDLKESRLDRLLAALAFYGAAHIVDKKVIPRFASNKSIERNTFGLLSA